MRFHTDFGLFLEEIRKGFRTDAWIHSAEFCQQCHQDESHPPNLEIQYCYIFFTRFWWGLRVRDDHIFTIHPQNTETGLF